PVGLVVEGAVVAAGVGVGDAAAVGVDDGGQAAVVGAAGHLAVLVLHLRRRAGVDGTGVRLPIVGQLVQAVEPVFYLVDDGGAGGVGITREEVGVALGVVRGVDPAHRAIDIGAQRGNGIRCL